MTHQTNIRAVNVISLCALVVSACGSNSRHVSTSDMGRLPPGVELDLEGTFTFSAAGDLELALSEPCTATRESERVSGVLKARLKGAYTTARQTLEPCNRSELDAIAVSATIPWAGKVRGVWLAPHHIVFRINWAQIDLDPFADDAMKVAATAWTVGDTFWIPRPSDAAHIVSLARQADYDRLGTGASPQLEVTAFQVEGNALRCGLESTLMVGVANRGDGPAYRVVVTIRSSLASLHTRLLTFGILRPGMSKVRTLRVTIPPSETSADTMLVLVVTEANGFNPANVSRRVKILPPANTPNLGMRCAFAERFEALPAFDAGQSVVLKCIVNNTGNTVATVKLEATIARDPAVVSRIQTVAVGGRSVFEIPLIVPRDLKLDSTIEIVVVAHDTVYLRIARTTLAAVVRKPKMCEPGQLTRQQYDAKIAELRAALTAGDLTQAQFDRYDAELVTCLP
jgi:hypothetical protein